MVIPYYDVSSASFMACLFLFGPLTMPNTKFASIQCVNPMGELTF